MLNANFIEIYLLNIYKSRLLDYSIESAKDVDFEQLQLRYEFRETRAGSACSRWLTAWIGELAEQDITCVIASAAGWQ